MPGTLQYPMAGGALQTVLTTGPIARYATDLWPLLNVMMGPDGMGEWDAFARRPEGGDGDGDGDGDGGSSSRAIIPTAGEFAPTSLESMGTSPEAYRGCRGGGPVDDGCDPSLSADLRRRVSRAGGGLESRAAARKLRLRFLSIEAGSERSRARSPLAMPVSKEMTAAQRVAAAALERAGAERIVPAKEVLEEIEDLLSDAIPMWAARMDTENKHTFLSRMTLATEEDMHDVALDEKDAAVAMAIRKGGGGFVNEKEKENQTSPSLSSEAAARRRPGYMFAQFIKLMAFGTAKPLSPRDGAAPCATVGSDSSFAARHTVRALFGPSPSPSLLLLSPSLSLCSLLFALCYFLPFSL